jgi:hypothetical protein
MLNVIGKFLKILFEALILLLVVDQGHLAPLLLTLVPVFGLSRLAKDILLVTVPCWPVKINRSVPRHNLILLE